jgi:ribosome recycling factor
VIDDTLLEAEEKMDKSVASTREELQTIRTGRASPNMFSKLVADYYGAPTPLNQLASFSVPEPRMAVISPFDKHAMAAIEKSIRDSDLGVNPTNDGNVIRVVFPQLTEERRRELIKVAKTRAEEGRVAIRSVRRHAKEALEKLQKNGDAGEDDIRRAEKELDEMTHRHSSAVDDLLSHKESELLEV